MSCRLAPLICAGVFLVSSPAFAQVATSDPPAHISFVEGSAVLERDGQPERSPANMPLLAGDRVRTEAGRVEILFADGSTLYLDSGTTVDFQSDELVRLLDGRIRLSIPGRDRQVGYRIDAPSGSVEIDSPGEYRVAVLHTGGDPEVELAVLRGSAELVTEDGRTPLRAGQHAYARANAAPSYAYVFNSASWDAFDRWAEARRDQRLAVSTQYLPEEVRPYAASFDRDGSWRYDTSYGYVWYPTVSAGWRPYYNGRWVTLRPYGWTWVGADPWAWPTHHYGRWGISAGVWFWIPGRTWAPAWVSWAYAPGYVSWCPLGWNNRPVLQIGGVYGRGYDPWRAWTAVPERRFGGGYDVRRAAARDVDLRTRRSFVTRETVPDARAYAVPRSTAPIRLAGAPSGRRGESPVYTNLEPGASRVGAAPSRTIVGPSRAAAPGAARGDQPEASQSGAGARTDANQNANAARPAPAGGMRPRGAGREIVGSARERTPGAASGGYPYGVRDRAPGSSEASSGGTGSTPGPSGRIERNGTRLGPPVGAEGPARARPRPAPYGDTPYGNTQYGDTQYGVPSRGVSRDNPAYRPMPGPASPGAAPAPDAVRPPVGSARPRDGSDSYGRPVPERRGPDRAPDSGARAVPRGTPGGERPAPDARPAPGPDRGGPASNGSAGAPASGGHSRSGGRGR